MAGCHALEVDISSRRQEEPIMKLGLIALGLLGTTGAAYAAYCMFC
jgi:hypothetical protein